MTEAFKHKLEELDVTPDELNRFTEALKHEEFRKLLAEYAEEISNPENRAIYEKELEQLENERGVDVTFIHPEPGHVLKTTQNGEQKCFINICKNSNVQKPSSEVSHRLDHTDGVVRKGITWSIPHSCAPPKEDLDKLGKKCVVYDVVFHPDSYRMGETNDKFKQLLEDTACDTIQKNFSVTLDRQNIRQLKMPFKGTPTATVVRKPKENVDEKFDVNNLDDPLTKIKTPYSYPPVLETTPSAPPQTPPVKTTNDNKNAEKPQLPAYTIPKYSIVHRGHADIQDCVNEKQHMRVNSTRPKELYIEIDLPLCKSAGQVKLDIFEKHLHLESQKPDYQLDLALPFPVNENDGNAKFDKTKKRLCVTLPVIEFCEQIEDNMAISLIEDVAVEELPTATAAATEIEPTLTVVEEQKQQQIKYIFPSKYELKQNAREFHLVLYTNNIDRNSMCVNFSPIHIVIKYESTSAGGYTTYYSACVKFDKDFIDSDTAYTVDCLNDKLVKIVFTRSNKNCVQNASLAVGLNDENFLDVNIESCEEAELKDVLKKIDNEEAAADTAKIEMKFETFFQTDTFTLSTSQELDEDDDGQREIVETTKASAEPSARKQQVSTSDSDELSSSASSSTGSSTSSNGTKLKSILKKSRSVSEGEGNLSGSTADYSHSRSLEESPVSNNSSLTSTNGSGVELSQSGDQKKSVKFNQEIKRTLFKSGSSVAEMKKPHTSKNRKRNMRRKRTTSDPSDDSSSQGKINGNVRERSYSESSDDSGGHFHSVNNVNSNSEEELNQEHDDDDDDGDDDNVAQQIKDHEEPYLEQQKKIQPVNKEAKNQFDMETMLSWKAADGNNNDLVQKTKCAFKFTNNVIFELDD